MLSSVRIVLVETSHPGNIGSAARAMKTMGLKNLYLVAPKLFPHPKATEMATNADDVLANAVVVSSLAEAITDCGLVVGTSARSRTIPWPMLSPREFAEKVIVETTTTENQVPMQTAVIFGREQSGLTNEELHACHFHLHIPSHADYTSLNLAAAVQVIAYELRMASLQQPVENSQWDFQYATAEELAGMYEHLERVLIALDFLNPKVPRQLMTRLRRLFNRARPDVMEVNILRGILSAVEKKSSLL